MTDTDLDLDLARFPHEIRQAMGGGHLRFLGLTEAADRTLPLSLSPQNPHQRSGDQGGHP